MRLELIEVDSTSEGGLLTPRAFNRRGVRREVVEVLDRWLEGGVKPGGERLDYFKVKADDSREYFLRYNYLFQSWAITV